MFGLPELSGDVLCLPGQCSLLPNEYEDRSGRHFKPQPTAKTMPRSILKFKKTYETSDSSNDHITMEFKSDHNVETSTIYNVVLEGAEILVSIICISWAIFI